MAVGQPKFLDNEIVRLGNKYWNKIEPSEEAIVMAVNKDNTVDIECNPGSGNALLIPKVPLMQPITTGNGLNIRVNDRVVIAYLNGCSSSPYVIGKF